MADSEPVAPAEVHDSDHVDLSPADHLAMAKAHQDAAAAHLADASAHLSEHPDASHDATDSDSPDASDSSDGDSARGMDRLAALSATSRRSFPANTGAARSYNAMTRRP